MGREEEKKVCTLLRKGIKAKCGNSRLRELFQVRLSTINEGIQEILTIPNSWCKIRDVYEPLSQGGQSLKVGF
jgi:hypothetical protein